MVAIPWIVIHKQSYAIYLLGLRRICKSWNSRAYCMNYLHFLQNIVQFCLKTVLKAVFLNDFYYVQFRALYAIFVRRKIFICQIRKRFGPQIRKVSHFRKVRKSNKLFFSSANLRFVKLICGPQVERNRDGKTERGVQIKRGAEIEAWWYLSIAGQCYCRLIRAYGTGLTLMPDHKVHIQCSVCRTEAVSTLVPVKIPMPD